MCTNHVRACAHGVPYVPSSPKPTYKPKPLSLIEGNLAPRFRLARGAWRGGGTSSGRPGTGGRIPICTILYGARFRVSYSL